MAEQTLKDKAAKGFLWGGINNSVMQLLNLLFGIVLATILSTEDYGLVSMLAVFTSLASVLQESGFISALINRKNAVRKDYSSVFWFNISCSALIYVILYLCAPLIATYYSEPRLIALSRYSFLGFFLASFSITPRAILMKNIRAKELAMTTMTATLAAGITGVVMALNGMAYWGIATQGIAYVSIVSILSWYFSGWRPSFEFSKKPIKEMFGFSSKMLITNIFNCINSNIFNIVLGGLYGAKPLGIYSQASNWNQKGGQLIMGMVQGVAQPTFVAIGEDKERLRRSFRKMLRLTSLIAFPTMLGLSFVARELILVTVKEKWLPSADIMRILCVGGAFMPLAALYYNFIISRGKSNIYMWNIIIQGCLVLLMLYSVSHFQLSLFGLSGIHLMTAFYVLICIAWTGVWHYFLWREIKLKFHLALMDMLPFMFLSVFSMFVTYWLTRSITEVHLLFASRIVCTALIYGGSLWMLGNQTLKECIGYILKRKK